MDEHMQIPDIARTLGISLETIRSYAERYALYLPVARVGAEVWYPPASVTLIEEIDQAVAAGATFEEIELSLQDYIPSMRLVQDGAPSQEIAPNSGAASLTIDDLARIVVEQRTQITDLLLSLQVAIEQAATAEQFHGLRAETASLAAALAMRDTQLEHANAVILSELRQTMSALQDEIAELRRGAQQSQIAEPPRAVTDPTPPEKPAGVAETTTPKPTEPGRDQRHRTPRRMGQPLRVNGLNGIGKN
jgi:DNA-binding transcriptional MerR regulator